MRPCSLIPGGEDQMGVGGHTAGRDRLEYMPRARWCVLASLAEEGEAEAGGILSSK